jgi:hypothetical protein
MIFLSGFCFKRSKCIKSENQAGWCLNEKNAGGKRKPAPEDGPKGDRMAATILLRQGWNVKTTVGAVRNATGFRLLLHKPT